MIRDHMQTEFHLGAQESAKALAAGEQAWFASQGLKYVPPSGKALYAQYIQEFEHKRGGFKSIADGTTDDVLGKVHEWYDNPGSVNDLRSALHDQFTPYNAERVARSESTRMASVQTTSMMADWGETKWRWESNGQNPCDECSALDGQVFELGEMEMPPDGTHPNCDCSASTLLPDEMPEGGGAQTRKRDVGNWLDIADIRTTPEWSQALDWRYQLGHYCYLRRMMGAANCSLQPARPRPSSFPTPETNPSYCRKCGVKLNRYHVATYCYAHGG
jgi:SPP1 gp7 family putative phage head morphogenesis protein